MNPAIRFIAPSRANRFSRLPSLLALVAGAGLSATTFAEKPAALSDLSVTVKESFDSNVFGTERNPTLAGLPEIADVESLVTLITPKVSIDLRPVLGLGNDTAITALSLGYTGDYAFYHSASSETNQRHTFTQQLKTKSGNTSFSVDNSLIYVDGKTAAPQYSLYSAYGTASARERREQFQDRAKIVFRQDLGSGFFRAVANVLYYDLKTQLHQPVGGYVGYQNFVDRQDLNLGFDYGYKATKDLSLWAGYRFGEQKQAQLPWDLRHNDSRYHRLLVGAEGKLAPWLKVDLSAGPDYRSYTDDTHLGLIGKSHTWLYTEGSLVAELSKNDSLTLSNKIWHWVSSTSVAAYRDSAYTATYKHKFSDALSGSLGYRVLGSDYDLPTTRKDWTYTYSAGLRYDFNKQYALTLDYARTEAKNKLSDVTFPGREFSQDLVSAGLRAAF